MKLGGIGLFDGFSAKELAELEKISFEKHFADGEIIFMEGENSTYLYILLEGRVDIVKSNSKLGEFFLHSIVAPSMIAELATFERLSFPASARAVGGVKIIKIEFESFKEKMLANPDVSYKFIRSLLQKMKILEGFIQKELNLGAEEKIINLLTESPMIFGIKKHIEIAKILNITPETLSRMLKRLKEQGVVEVEGKRVTLVRR
jgi:CRP/FNR family transcriptional regulator, dissimilatory nitrate respiration regulator